MKKINLLFLFFIIMTTVSYGQFAVIDATANTNLININANLTKQSISESKNLAEAVQHTSYLDQTLKFWKNTSKILEDINGAITTMFYVTNLVNREIESIKLCSKYASDIRKMKRIKLNEVNIFVTQLNSTLATSNELLKLANSVLTSKVFKMNDSERIKTLIEINEKIEENLSAMSYCFSQADNLNRVRSLQFVLNN